MISEETKPELFLKLEHSRISRPGERKMPVGECYV